MTDADGNRRRILFIVTKMDQGGAMSLPLHMAAEFRSRGYDAETWYLYFHASAYEHEPGTRVILPRPVTSLIDYVQVFFMLLRAMRQYRPDVVHGIAPLGNIFGTMAAYLIGCRVRVASQHNPSSTFHPVMRFLDRILGTVGIYTGNIAVSEAVRESYDNWPHAYRDRLQVILNGIPPLPPAMPRHDARVRFDLPENAFVIGNVGRLSDQKNQQFLFDVVKRMPAAHLAIAGDGPLHAAYETEIRKLGLVDRVHLLGSLPESLVPSFFAAIDVFAMPSLFEGLPIALIEATQAALPIIASNIPPVREVLGDRQGRQAGRILDIDDPQRWADACDDLRRDPAAAAKLANAAETRAQIFSIERMVDEYEACFFPPVGCVAQPVS